MLEMNDEQRLGLIRQLITGFGYISLTLGWLTQDQVGVLTANALAIVGPISVLGSLGWGLYAKRKAGILRSAAALPEVKKITLDPRQSATVELNKATPTNVVVDH